jgi:hypothetical protein
MIYTSTDKDISKKLQSRFFHGNVLAQNGHYLTTQEVDDLRDEALKAYKSLNLKRR